MFKRKTGATDLEPWADPRLRTFILLLGSDQEGEANAARKKLLNLLEDRGFSLHDLVDRVQKGEPVRPEEPGRKQESSDGKWKPPPRDEKYEGRQGFHRDRAQREQKANGPSSAQIVELMDYLVSMKEKIFSEPSWEFVSDMEEKYERWGGSMFVSPKQWDWLLRIAEGLQRRGSYG